MSELKLYLGVNVTPETKTKLKEIANGERRSMASQAELFIEHGIHLFNARNKKL